MTGASEGPVVLEGRLAPGCPDWIELPFEVPSGVRELTVRYSYDRPQPPLGVAGNALDIGIFDPRGFRGYSGGARDSFRIGAGDATPGYLPGPVEAGTWRILLGPYTVHPDGLAYRIEITPTIGPPEPAFVANPAPERANGRGRGWYRGDLHTHTRHSDGEWTPEELASTARRSGLDFVFSTEHNTPTAHGIWGHHAGDDLLILNGLEVTTRNGHLVAGGLPAGSWYDWRFRAVDGALPSLLEKIHRDSGIAIAAHPHCPFVGCQWKFGFEGVDAVEVWNGPWTPDDEVSLQQWNSTLVAGPRWVPAVGASDTHKPEQTLGLAQTVVLADDLSREAILEGLRAGRVYVAESASVSIGFTARAPGDRTAEIGERLRVDADTPVTVSLHVAGVDDGYARFVTDEGWMAQLPLPASGRVEWTTTAAVAKYVRAEVRRNGPSPLPGLEPMAAFTNPILLGV